MRLVIEERQKVRNTPDRSVETQVLDHVMRAAGGRAVPTDLLLAELARRQYGVVARRQLLAMGVGPGAIDTRLNHHYLHRLHRGVYAVGHLALVPLAREMAAALACGAGAAISHRSAAAVWHLLAREEKAPVDVTVRGTGGRQRPGLRIHSSACLSPGDLRHLRGLPLTSPARSLIDLAEAATDRELERAADAAITRRLVEPRRLAEETDRYRGRRGVGRLRALLDANRPATVTRSQAEERFLALARAGGLPPPEVNTLVDGYEIDFLWREQQLAVEIDGFRFHSSRQAFERDRRRDADLQARGLSVLRFTWRQIIDEPYATLATTARALRPA